MAKRICTLLLLCSLATPCFAQPAESAGSGMATSPSLDQANKELLAQEELLLKQVGEVAPVREAAEPVKAEPIHVAPEKAQPQKEKAATLDIKAVENSVTITQKAPPAEPPAAVSAKSTANCDTTQLAAAQAKVRKLTADLDEARNRLMISETEVERLAHLVDERNRGSTRMAATSSAPRASLAANGGMRVREPAEIQAKAESDMPIATVITEKAQLRTGPGKDNSPLMSVSQGTRLAIETRNGDWYRVISPTGARAWVSSDVIDFGDKTRPDSAARGKGLTNSSAASADAAEDAAFQAISRGVKK